MKPKPVDKLPKIAFAATVVNVLHRGQDNGKAAPEPYRAVVQNAKGERYILTSYEKLDVNAMGDVIGVAHLRENAVKGMPDELIIPQGTPVQNRLRNQIDLTDPNAKFSVKSFGKALEANRGPGWLEWLGTGAWFGGDIRRSISTKNVAPGITVVDSADRSADPLVRWGAELFAPVAKAGSMAMMEADAFVADPMDKKLAAELKKSPRKAMVHAIRRKLKRGADVKRDMPIFMQTMLPQALTYRLWDQPGVTAPVMQARTPHDRSTNFSFVKSYSPYATFSLLFGGLAVLSPNHFLPKKVIKPEMMRAFVMAHEMAHAVQNQYGVGFSMFDKRELNQGEKFADSFAMLATAQRYGDFDALDYIANMRHTYILTAGSGHWTGPAAEEAAKTARQLAANGTLKNMTTDDMLTLAAKIARKHTVTNDEFKEIVEARKAVFEQAGLKTKKAWIMKIADGMVADPDAGLNTSLVARKALADPKNPLGKAAPYMQRALQALDTVAYGPEDLKDPDTRKAAMALYEQDLKEMVKASGHDASIVATMMAGELKRLEQGSKHFNKKEGQIQKIRGKVMKYVGSGVDPRDMYRGTRDDKKTVVEAVTRAEAANLKVRRVAPVKAGQPRKSLVTLVRRQDSQSTTAKMLGLTHDERIAHYMAVIRAERDAVRDAQKALAPVDKSLLIKKSATKHITGNKALQVGAALKAIAAANKLKRQRLHIAESIVMDHRAEAVLSATDMHDLRDTIHTDAAEAAKDNWKMHELTTAVVTLSATEKNLSSAIKKTNKHVSAYRLDTPGDDPKDGPKKDVPPKADRNRLYEARRNRMPTIQQRRMKPYGRLPAPPTL
ncbi:MAG: hypothetical protein Alpg2KO_01350 [Alphaproteobacteria bacterium]